MTQAARKVLSKESLIYTGLIVGVIAVYLAIRAYGDTLGAPAPASPADATTKLVSVHVNDFVHVLLALALVIAAARLLGSLFRWIHQPPVVGEMIAGIMLGPSLLGHLAPGVAAYILPQSIAPLLNVISQFGVILYMFLVGLELDLSSLRTQAHSTVIISHASIITPFILGSSLALLLYPQLSNNTVSFTAFSLFLGVSMSVTAFPVLARILTDRRIHKTKMGSLTLACAAIDDVTAWCLLAFVVSVTQAHTGNALRTVLMAVGYVVLMLLAIRPLMTRLTGWIDARGRLSQGILALVLLGILLSSLATESIGIHSIFGAFVLGAIIPHRSGVARELTGKLEDFVIVFLLPAFFAFTGLRTQIGLVSGWHNWVLCFLILVVASIGKFGGSSLAARLNGLGWRDASAIGILMNTRGLMELIVLNIGLELHVISPTLFAMLVLMALATTLATTPILHFVTPRGQLEGEANAIAEADRLTAMASERTGVLVPVSNTSAVNQLIELAASLSPSDGPPPRVLALNRGSVTGVGARVHEEESFSLSRSPILAAALDAAWSRKVPITPEAVWTTDAATEIVEAAERSRVRWLLLESQRSIFGQYPRRSVVNRVMEKVAKQPLQVAVVLPSFSLQSGSVSCVVSGAGHGCAALELALRICESSHQDLQVLVPRLASGAEVTTSTSLPDWLNKKFNGVRSQILPLLESALR
ncbi:MAG TPA: cation:proton antiporter, partial [Bryobacteraceae bacterium]|nr:cation:proton antiporter [Bryobacteraceae bacterium]